MKGSSFTTFLMFLPLIAIPVLAIFGIPEFAPVSASPNSPHDPVVIKGPGAAASNGSANSAADFAPYSDGKSNGETTSMGNDPFLFPDGSKADPFPHPKGIAGWEVAPNRKGAKSKIGENKGIITTGKRASTDELDRLAAPKLNNGQFAVPSGSELTWADAIQRLKKHGITEYVLQPGTQPQACHFSCLYRSPNNPRITRRFEAEGPSPLKAATNVLAQLESRR